MLGIISKTARIKRKLIVINLLTTGIALIVTGSALMLTVYFSFRDSLIENLTAQAKVLAGNSAAPLVFNDQKQAGEDLRALKASPNIARAIIYGKDGKIFAEYRRNVSKKDVSTVPLRAGGYLFTAEHLHLYHGIQLDGETIGTLYLRSNLKQLHALMLRYGVITAITTAIVFVIAFLLLTRLQRVITGPIFSLARSMRTVSIEGNYSLRADVFNEDEIGFLARGFNEMLEQIQKSDMKLQLEIAERKKAEEETLKLNEELEMKVGERTRQLLDAQEELVRNEKLATLGQLSGSVGHELRNPLGVMSNALYFLNAVMTDADETVKEYLDIIKQEINNSQRIITDLLDFARVKTPQSCVITARELVADSLRRCVIPESVQLQTDIPESVPKIVADPLQMGQVFENLITNAVQAMPDGGNLRIRARPVRSSRIKIQGSEETNIEYHTSDVEHDADFLEISVEDTGEGISAENMKKLFQPLFTTKARGIGLGLTVCGNLTEANGGSIEVKSRLGEGTTFAVLLPVEGSRTWKKE